MMSADMAVGLFSYLCISLLPMACAPCRMRPRPWRRAKRAILHCQTACLGGQYGPFGIAIRPVLQCAVRQGDAQWQRLCIKNYHKMRLSRIKKALAHGVPVFVFIVLVGSSAMASVGSYCATADLVEGDLRRALADTIAAKGAYYAANDTIRTFRGLQAAAGGNVVMRVDDATFRRNIASGRLRESAYLQVSIVGGPGSGGGPAVAGGGGIATDAVVLRSADGASAVALRGCAGCSAASVLAMSDQRLPLALFAAALLWAFGCAAGRRRASLSRRRASLSRARAEAYGGLELSADGALFVDAAGEPVRLTPMQHRLLAMFFAAEGHSLSHREICDALWPKKPDASDTLYTLIRRLRCVVEQRSSLRIESDRGRAYRLTDR